MHIDQVRRGVHARSTSACATRCPREPRMDSLPGSACTKPASCACPLQTQALAGVPVEDRCKCKAATQAEHAAAGAGCKE